MAHRRYVRKPPRPGRRAYPKRPRRRRSFGLSLAMVVAGGFVGTLGALNMTPGGREAAAGIPLLIFNLDDLEPRLPFRNAVLFHPGPTRSFRRRHPLTFAIPSFTREHVEEFGEAGPYPLPNALDVPTVGFCGLARNPSPRAYASMTVRNVRLHAYHGLTPAGRVLRYKARGNSPLFRGAILRRLAASPLLKTRFLYRDGTMSFAASDEARTRMRREFVDNMLNSEYAVCIRGNGNFSIRFYEALAAGRIPLHISTDDVLPYDFSVDWTKHIISVAADDIDSAPQLVFDHHFVSSHEDRVIRAKKNNELWRARMTSRGFLDHFHEFIDEITKTAR